MPSFGPGPDEPELPILLPGGGRGGHPPGFGAAGRLDGQHPAPGEVAAVGQGGARGHLGSHRSSRTLGAAGLGRPEHQDVGAVGEAEQGDVGPGRGRLQGGREQQRRVGGAGLADAGAEVIGDGADGVSKPAGQGRHRPGVHPGDDEDVDVTRGQPGGLQRRLPGGLAGGEVAAFAEALLPEVRRHLARSAPAVDELVGASRRAHQLGEEVTVVAGTDQEGGGAVAPCRLVRPPRPPDADVAAQHERGRRGAQRQLERPQGGAARPVEVVGADLGGEAQSGVDGGGVGAIGVRRGGGGEQDGTGGDASGLPQGQPPRLHRHGRGVLVVGGHRSGAPPSAAPRDRRYLGPGQPPVGKVGGVSEDAMSGGERSAGRAHGLTMIYKP